MAASMPSIALSSLLRGIVPGVGNIDPVISGLALDSRLVKPGDLFLAYVGTHLDGREYIAEALAQGANAILAEANTFLIASSLSSVPIVLVPDLKQHVSQIAATFFEHPGKSLRIVGITGTNGKTSCSHFIAAILQQLNHPCGVIGTLGSGIFGHLQFTGLTTPDAVALQATFADFVKQKVNTVAMEVSSHSIDQGRIQDIEFSVGIFTNLTRDHLDYHGTMENYAATKKRLFDNPHLQRAVINADDAFGQDLIASLSATKEIYSYGIKGQHPLSAIAPSVIADNVKLDDTGVSATVHTPWGTGELQAALIGQFNLSNLLAVLTTLCLLEVPLADALTGISRLRSVPGRMETFGGNHQPLVVVDYAHTPDALEKVLIALRHHCKGQLFCVFGCGGDRDKGKRPMMAKIAERYADSIVITDDNPRHEVPAQIVADIMEGFCQAEQRRPVIVEHDRSQAIQDVIQCAAPGDCVLIAGKGAETYQQIGDTKIAFSDVEQVKISLI
jgi:UDP-N-acetylmuramoyl-L-alanyl-D-glutamate--2,6-diaminopimelate ligase